MILTRSEERRVGKEPRRIIRDPNRLLTASEISDLCRSRNDAETMFRDLKHGIDRRPVRCTSEYAVKGRIPISFSLTVMVDEGNVKRRVFSNLGKTV